MERTLEGGSLRSESGYERRKVNDVILSNGAAPPYIDRDFWIDYAIQSGVDFEKLPRIPFWAKLAGYSDAWVRSNIGADLKRTRYMAQRPLSQEEAQRLAAHSAMKCGATTHYTPVWMITTGFFCWRGWNSYRFPFYTPKPASLEWVYRRIFSPIGIKSAHAPFVFHAFRLLSYSILSKWLMGGLFRTGSNGIFVQGVINDRQLQDLAKDLRRYAENFQRSKEENQRRQRVGVPTSPVGQPERNTVGGDEQTDPAVAQFEELQRQAQPELEQEQRRVPVSTQTRRAEPEPQYRADDDDPFDDASPVAPSARRQQNLDASTPVGGSAWTRLRTKAFVERTQEQANEGSAALPRTSSWEERRQQNLQGGSYTYSQERQTGDDRNSAAAAARSREQAQKEFDAMLERERKGSD